MKTNVQHQKPKPTWYRLRFSFPSMESCNTSAFDLAARLRGVFPHVYFIHYPYAAAPRLDVLVNLPGKLPTVSAIRRLVLQCVPEDCRTWTRAAAPKLCHGDFTLAIAFDFALRFQRTATERNLSTLDRFKLWSTTLNGAHQMISCALDASDAPGTCSTWYLSLPTP